MSKRPPITTHVLDTARGCPAAGVPIRLYKRENDGLWVPLGAGVTNEDGRIADWLPGDHALEPGVYRMHFDTGAYFQRTGTDGFYPYAEVVFEIRDTRSHYHIPLLLCPFGYSTYRGS